MSFRHSFMRCIIKSAFRNSSPSPVISNSQLCRFLKKSQPSSYSPNRCEFRMCSNAAYEHCPKEVDAEGSSKGAIGKIQPKLFLAFTCKVCNARIEKHISKIAYTKGVVIVRCDGCKENHLIADNKGWFPDLKAMRNIEDIMEAQGETVKKSLDNPSEKAT